MCTQLLLLPLSPMSQAAIIDGNNNLQSTGSYRQIITLALPLMVGILINQINFFTNTFFLGHFGKNELAANGVASIYYLIFTMICVGFNNGVQIILSRRAGEGDGKALGRVFGNSIKLGLLLCITAILVSLVVAPYLFTLQIHNTDIQALALSFISIRIFGLPFFFLEQASNQFNISIGKSKNILMGVITATVVNIIADYLLINGHYGLPQLGIKGAAIASVMAECSYVLVAYGYIYWRKLHITYPFALRQALDKKLSIETIKIASPVMLQYFFSISSWMLFYLYIEHLGKNELAISQILRSIFGLVGASSWALASSSNSLVSNYIGQGRQAEVMPLLHKIVRLSLPIALILGSLLLLFHNQFIATYTNDAELIAASWHPIIVVVSANVLLSITMIYFNGMLGTGNTSMNLIAECTAIVLYITYIYIVVEHYKMNLAWAWCSEFLYWTVLLLFSLSYLKWGKWQLKKV
jgi:multidrug resistance protein, MATE family